MAIFDSEKRPRGLRVPSLTAMKNGTAATKSQFSFHSKKSNDSRPDPSSTPSLTTIVPASTPAPPKTKAIPPPNKDLPPTPKEESPQPVSAQVPPRSSSMVPPRREVLRKPPPSGVSPVISSPVAASPVGTAPKTGLRQASPQSSVAAAPVAVPPQAPPQSQAELQQQSQAAQAAQSQPTYTQPHQQSPITQSLPVYHSLQTGAPPPPVTNQASRGPVPTAAQAEVPTNLNPSQQPTTDALTPLEDFIPTPEGASTPLDQTSSDGQTSYTPSDDVEPIAAPLSKIHYACFQEHRNMPIAQNTWCPVPCMTCQKMDREIRHRCVFCCLRVCEGCYLALQGCGRRSLAEFMGQLNGH